MQFFKEKILYFKPKELSQICFILFILNFSSVPFEERILAVLKWLQLPKDERYVLCLLLCFIEVTQCFEIGYKKTLVLALRFYVQTNSLVSYYSHILKNLKPVSYFLKKFRNVTPVLYNFCSLWLVELFFPFCFIMCS